MFLLISTKAGASLKKIFGWDDWFNFLENISFRTCLFKSGLNNIFHLQANSDIFCRSLFSSFAEMLLSCKTEEDSEGTVINKEFYY